MSPPLLSLKTSIASTLKLWHSLLIICQLYLSCFQRFCWSCIIEITGMSPHELVGFPNDYRGKRLDEDPNEKIFAPSSGSFTSAAPSPPTRICGAPPQPRGPRENEGNQPLAVFFSDSDCIGQWWWKAYPEADQN